MSGKAQSGKLSYMWTGLVHAWLYLILPQLRLMSALVTLNFNQVRRAVVSYWRKYVHKVLVNRLGGLSLPRKSVVRLTDRPDMTSEVYRGRKTTMQQQQQFIKFLVLIAAFCDIAQSCTT